MTRIIPDVRTGLCSSINIKLFILPGVGRMRLVKGADTQASVA